MIGKIIEEKLTWAILLKNAYLSKGCDNNKKEKWCNKKLKCLMTRSINPLRPEAGSVTKKWNGH